MQHFIRHKVIPEKDGYKLILYVDQTDTEFAAEFGNSNGNQPVNLESRVQKYIKEKIPDNIIVKTVQIVVGTIVLSTLSLNGIPNSHASAATSPISSEVNNHTYTVKAGDTLYKIATQNNLTVDQLKQANNLTSNSLQIGQVLNLSSTLTTSPEVTTTYTVVSGDTLWSIANRFGTTVNALKETNHLLADTLKLGQVLIVPSSGNQTNTTTPSANTQSYTVLSGDSLWGISRKFGTTVEAIRSANQLTSDQLSIGQVLTIPSNGTITTPAPTVEQQTTYTVKAGDSLWGIAKQFNTTVNAMKQTNQLTSDSLAIGQILKIPNTSTPIPAPVTNDTSTLALQKQLQELGYYAVPVTTGSLDSVTVQAIKTFQSDYGLLVTGNSDVATRTALDHAIVKKALVANTNNYIGVPYLWGGTTPRGFDCSGFVYYMFNQQGVDMARTTSSSLYTMGTAISRSNLQPGDLVFYGVNTPGVVSHVGFYVGNNKFVSATSSSGIQVVSLDNSYWSKYFIGAKRVY